MIKCTECGHENDVTRIFCQNCGTRLERPDGAGEAFTPTTPSPDSKAAGTKPAAGAPKKPGKLKEAGPSPLRIVFKILFFFFNLIAIVLLAVLIAAIIQMSRLPDFRIPSAQRGIEGLAVQFTQGVKLAADNTYPRSLDIQESAVNNYLQARILAEPTAETGGINLHAEFARTFLVFRSGFFNFVVEQKFSDYPFYVYLDVKPVSSPAGTDVKITSGGIGRLRIDEEHVPYLVDKFFSPITAVLTDQINTLKKANSVVMHDSLAKVNWPGKVPPKP